MHICEYNLLKFKRKKKLYIFFLWFRWNSSESGVKAASIEQLS